MRRQNEKIWLQLSPIKDKEQQEKRKELHIRESLSDNQPCSQQKLFRPGENGMT